MRALLLLRLAMLGILLLFSTAQCGRARFDFVPDSAGAEAGAGGDGGGQGGASAGLNGVPGAMGGFSAGTAGLSAGFGGLSAGFGGVSGRAGGGGVSGGLGVPGGAPGCIPSECAGDCRSCPENDCGEGDCVCGRCVECNSDSSCPADFACDLSTGRCVRICQADHECRYLCRRVGTVPLGCTECLFHGTVDIACENDRDGMLCHYGTCVECLDDQSCPSQRPRCIAGECTCLDDHDCEGRLRCNRGQCQ